MSFEFKNLSDVDRLDKPSDSSTVMGFENGKPVQFPVSKVGGAGATSVMFRHNPDTNEITCSVSFEELRDMLCSFSPINACIYECGNVSDDWTPTARFMYVRTFEFMPDGSDGIQIYPDTAYSSGGSFRYTADGLSFDGGAS